MGMTREASIAISFLYTVANNSGSRTICRAIVSWVDEAFQNWEGATLDDVYRFLVTTDCSACHAPQGLIWNSDIWAKVYDWGQDIDQALWEYADETGTNYQPPTPSGELSIGGLVWFAVEWNAHRLATALEDQLPELRKVLNL